MSVITIIMTDWTISQDKAVILGFSGENETKELRIQCDELKADASYYLDIESSSGKDIALMTAADNTLSILLTAKMLGGSGRKRMQIREVLGEVVTKSNVFIGEVNTSVNAVEAYSRLPPSEFEQYESQMSALSKLVEELKNHPGTGGSGAPGEKGDKGDKGDPGEDGADGKSAYELAVENGFNGSMSEWLASLKGDKGDRGEQGIKGDKGDKGADGSQGIQGVQGERGEKGETGAKGADGADGKSAYELAVDNGFSGTLSEWLNSLKGEKGDSSSPKTLITIIDDDGTNCTSDANTGIRTFLHEKNIPLTFAVPVTAPTKSSGTYSIAQLTEMIAEGDEVIMHGYDANDSDNRNTLEAFKTNVDAAIAWAKENNFNSKSYVYPGGLYPNLSTDFNAKIAYLKSKGIEMAYTVNNPCESSSREGFEEWNTYENGADYYGTYNKVPFVEMPNGFSHALLINRAEVGSNNLTVKWWKNRVDDMIEKQAYMCFFIHSFMAGFKTADSNGKTYADYFKELIQYIVDTYGDRVQFVTPSKAHEIIEDMPVTTGMVEKTVANYIEDHKDALKGDAGESGVERQITVSNAVTSYSIKPNILYVFPEESVLTISFDETGIDTSVVNDYHFQFTNGSTPCELNLPESVNIGDYEPQANGACEISIVNGLMSFRNWSTEE